MMKAPPGHRRAHVLGTDNLGRDILSRDHLWLPGVASGRLCRGFRFGFCRHHARRDLRLFRRQDRFPDSKTGRGRLGFSAAAARHHDHGIFRPRLFNLILALVAQRWIPYCRVVRGQTLSLRGRDFVTAAQCLGASNRANHHAPYYSQSDSNFAGHRHLRHGIVDHRRSEFELSRRRRAAGYSHLGHHAGRRAHLYQHRLVAAAFSRPLHLCYRLGHQFARRRSARPPRSATQKNGARL